MKNLRSGLFKNTSAIKINVIPLIVVLLFFLTALSCWLCVVSKGFIPPGDALRHVAKVVSDKSWDEVVVLRKDFDGNQDTHPGWHFVLNIFNNLGLTKDELVCVSLAIPWFFVFVIYSIVLKRPECFILALCIGFMLEPGENLRVFLGRPYLITMGMTTAYLYFWDPSGNGKSPILLQCGATIVLSAIQVWIHPSSWYLLGIPASAVFCSGLFARRFKYPFLFIVCLVFGVLIASMFCGHPISMFSNNFKQLQWAVLGGNSGTFLVPELLPTYVKDGTAVILIILFTLRIMPNAWVGIDWRHPFIWLTIIGLFSGFFVYRFWLDWGLVGLLAWISIDFQEVIKTKIKYNDLTRLILAACVSIFLVILVLGAVRLSNPNKIIRNTAMIEKSYLEDKSWFPGDNGIIYSNSNSTFYQIFYTVPEGNWRYMFGFEQGLMPENDRQILLRILKDPLNLDLYEAWTEKMDSQDRLIISNNRVNLSMIKKNKNLSKMQWKQITVDKFIGRLKID
jgi:hypothetical protein